MGRGGKKKGSRNLSNLERNQMLSFLLLLVKVKNGIYKQSAKNINLVAKKFKCNPRTVYRIWKRGVDNFRDIKYGVFDADSFASPNSGLWRKYDRAEIFHTFLDQGYS